MANSDFNYETSKRFMEVQLLSSRLSNEYNLGHEIANFYANAFYEQGLTISNYSENSQKIYDTLKASVGDFKNEKEEVVIRDNIRSKEIPKEKLAGKYKKAIAMIGIASLIFGSGLIVKNSLNDIETMETMQDHINNIAKVEYSIANENTNIVGYDDNGWPETELNYYGVVADLVETYTQSPELFDSAMYTIYDNINTIGIEHQEYVPEETLRANQFEHMENVFAELKKQDTNIEQIANCKNYEDYIFKIISESDVMSPEEIAELKAKFSEKYVDNKYVKKLSIAYYKAMLEKNKVLSENLEDSERSM